MEIYEINKGQTRSHKREFLLLLIGSILSFFAASVLTSGWQEGLVPNLSYPFSYGGDANFNILSIKRVIEGWISFNYRSGYPYGSNFLDFPNCDFSNFVIIKILSFFTNSPIEIFNLYFLLSFPVVFIASFFTLLALRLNSWFSFSASLIYTFSFFHFARLNHLFYTWYFVAPIFFYISFEIYQCQKNSFSKYLNLSKILLLFICIFLLASFGIYYSLFGLILIAIGGVAGSFRTNSLVNLKKANFFILSILFVVFLNLAPSFINNHTNGINIEAVERSSSGAEIYGFKLIQLLLPNPNHRFSEFANISKNYNNSRSYVNENVTSSIGLIGCLGIFIIFFQIFSPSKNDPRIYFFSICCLILFLFGTIGGLGAIFSSVITPSIRGWNRISIFIGFASISVFFFWIDYQINKLIQAKWRHFFYPIISLLFLSIGILDQTKNSCTGCNDNLKRQYNLESNFIIDIEGLLPINSAIYQLPYMKFPESPPLYRLNDYDLAVGFMFSRNLYWSYGGLKGRESDLLYRQLSETNIRHQVDVIKNLGFSGIYLDKRGYEDGGEKVILEISKLIGSPTLVRQDNNVVFFKIPNDINLFLGDLNKDQVTINVNAALNNDKKYYDSSLIDGILFYNFGFPQYIKSVSGLDVRENWGRWTNSNLSPSFKISYLTALPKNFELHISAISYGPNADSPTIIKVGNALQEITISNKQLNLYKLNFKDTGSSNFMEIIPPNPIAPHELDPKNPDTRKLGIGLVSMKIIPSSY